MQFFFTKGSFVADEQLHFLAQLHRGWGMAGMAGIRWKDFFGRDVS